MLLRSMTLVFYVLVLVVLCLTVVYSKPACNEGFYTKNGNLILDLHNFQSQFDCVQRMHRGNCHVSGCERPFSVQKIPHSNLILLVVDTLCPCGSKQLDIEPMEESGIVGACSTRRQSQEQESRRRPKKCINYHPEEIEIQQCGRGSTLLHMSASLVAAHLLMVSVTFVLANA